MQTGYLTQEQEENLKELQDKAIREPELGKCQEDKLRKLLTLKRAGRTSILEE